MGFDKIFYLCRMNEKVAKVIDFLECNGLEFKMHEHEPLPTIVKAMEFWKELSGTHCKNLFFRNHKGNRHYLVILECHKTFDVRSLELELKQGKLSFASPQRMEKYLGVKPGSVSIFGLLNDEQKHVKLYLDKDLLNAKTLTFHPNDNRFSLEISKDDMLRVIELWGGEWEEI